MEFIRSARVGGRALDQAYGGLDQDCVKCLDLHHRQGDMNLLSGLWFAR